MPLDTAVRKRLADWRDKLIDLTRGNRLLNYRPHAASSVRVVEEDPNEIADLLLAARTLVFDPKPKDGAGEPIPEGALRTGDQRLQTTLSSERLHKVLTRLYREAKASIEEQGFNTLYLGLGILTFATPDDSRGFNAPLLLLPVELKRRGARSDFRLHAYDDEPIVNPALVVKLRQDHGVELVLPEEEELLTYERVLAAFAPARERLGGAILDEIHLGLFSFAKIPLYNDLLAHEETIGAHDIAAALARGLPLAVEGDPALPAPHDVEAAADPAQSFQILDADSSQQAAILAARSGRSFVLQGPPGTGKSQTIANIIAEALAADRTVLFVSEKMAALEVVQRRLTESGLGAFCLELHSRKANKREVVQSMARAWSQASAAAGKEEGVLAELAELRALLGDYVRALHEPRGEAHYSAFEIFGHAARYRGVPEVPFPVQDPLDVSRRRLKNTERRLRTATPLLEAVAPVGTHPWRAALRTSVGVSTLDDARRALNLLLSAIDGQLGAHAALADALGQAPAATVQQATAHAAFAARLLETTRPPEAWIAAADWAGLSPRVRRAVEQGAELEQVRQTLLGRYRESVLDLNAADLDRRARPGGFLFGWWRRRSARKLLGAHRSAASPGLAADVALLMRRTSLRAEIEAADAALLQAFGNEYEGPAGGFARLAAHQAWIESLRAAWPADLDLGEAILAAVRGEGHEAIRAARAALEDARRELETRATALVELLELDRSLAWAEGIEQTPLADQRETAETWIERINDLPAWVHWQGARAEAAAAGLRDYLDAFEDRALQPVHLLDAWFRTWYRAAADVLLEDVDVLRAFDGRVHEANVDRFRVLDHQQIQSARRRIAARLRAAVPDPNVRSVGDSEVGTLKREIGKQRRHLPTRILLERIPQLLRLLKPCLMMSPLSVATYLPPGRRLFDLVVFDEASQICTEDGVGAIARGRQVVVCGDSQQLPPTRFFERRMEEGDDAPEDVLVDLPSILDECKAGPLPQIPLMWHYRSRDESLITFSNRHFYEGSLVTFPNAARDDEHLGISFHHIADGVYHPGAKGSRSNPIEAAAVADRVLEILATRPEESVGVVTFSTTQRDEVLDALDERRRGGDPFVDRFDSAALEPVFVKNLEAVQGDERDVILFSVGYGRDPQGALRLNFGPLNKEGGDRRLNVAVTRARKQVVVYSSILPEDIDTERAKGRGSRLLRDYLETARRGMDAKPAVAPAKETEAAADQPALLDSIQRELARQGFDADARVGNSEFKVDLAVRDPDRPGRYLLAILCDGPSYAGAATARDRDRTRCEALERLGWRVHRIWAPDWVRAPGHEMERIASAVDRARAGETPEPSASVSPTPIESPEPVFDFSADEPGALRGVVDYEVAKLRPRGPAAEYHVIPIARLASALEKVVAAEGPLHEDLAARRLAIAWGITRSTSKVMTRFQEAADALAAEGKIECRGPFLHPLPAREIQVRGPAEGVQREVEEIPPEEVEACTLLVVDAYLGLARESLVREMGRAFGFKRLTEKLAAAFEPTVERLVESGKLGLEGDRIVRTRDETDRDTAPVPTP